MSTPKTPMDCENRITNYLGNGGLFNPELMEHGKVKDMILECRDELVSARQQITELQKKCRAADDLAAVYANKENWHCRVEDSYSGLINEWTAQGLDDDSDEDFVDGDWTGGKRARQFQKDYPKTE